MTDRAICIVCDASLGWTKADEGPDGWSVCHPCGLAAWEMFPNAAGIDREHLLKLRAHREWTRSTPHGPVCLPPRFSGVMIGMFPVQIGDSDQVLLVQPDDTLPVC